MEKNEEIISSISYAQQIQNAVLPFQHTIDAIIPNSFILYKPRGIVSGDFYWLHEINKDNYIIVCADCTGHGVPGAFMTFIGNNSLSQIVVEGKTTEPVQILTELDKKITATLKQEKATLALVQDGMDLSLLKVNKETKEFIFTSAKRSAILIRNTGELQELKGSKFSLGGIHVAEKLFYEQQIKYKEGDMIYLFTDGYIDQFGVKSDKKFMIKRFRELLSTIYHLPLNEQRQKLEFVIEQWKGNIQQTDDILVMGIKL
ncbi:MAG: SpoIIE family protein phosphatase [Bacteroidetes bacterium]|nr:SpoIIE family protein phosphatase [Bacteroidota bacterium]